MNNFIYINNATRKIGRATHASFDEAQLSTPVADLNSNSLALWGALNRNRGTTIPPMDEVLILPTQFGVFAGEYSFLRVTTVIISIRCTFESLGLMLEEYPMSHCNIIAYVRRFSSASRVGWKELLQFHTVVQVDAAPVFSIIEVLYQLRKCDISVQPSVSLIVAPYRPDRKDQKAPPPPKWHWISYILSATFSMVGTYWTQCSWSLRRTPPTRPPEKSTPTARARCDETKTSGCQQNMRNFTNTILVECGAMALLIAMCRQMQKVWYPFGIILKRAPENTEQEITLMASSSFAWVPRLATPMPPAWNSTVSGCASR
jgi:hypothetical protein